MIPALLAVFAILDGTFAGYRAAAGCNGRIDKRRHYIRAMAKGGALAFIAVTLLGGLTAVVVACAPEPERLWSDLLSMGARLVLAFGVFTGVVIGALIVHAVSKHEVRTLASVSILGPFTLARPWLVIGATAWATPLASTWHPVVLAWTSSLAILGVGLLLHRQLHRPDSPVRVDE